MATTKQTCIGCGKEIDPDSLYAISDGCCAACINGDPPPSLSVADGRRRDAIRLIDEVFTLGRDAERAGSAKRLELVYRELAVAREHLLILLALLAPEPEPSDAEIEAAMNVLFRDSICGFAGGLVSGRGNYTSSEHYRQLAEKTLAAARAARQTGGA